MQNLIMNYPAATRNGVSIGIVIISPKGGELNLYPPQEGLSAVFLADLSASGGGRNMRSILLS